MLRYILVWCLAREPTLQYPVQGWHQVLGEILSGCLECTSLQIVGGRRRGCISSKPWSCYTRCSSSHTICLQDAYRTVWLPDPYLLWWLTQSGVKEPFSTSRILSSYSLFFPCLWHRYWLDMLEWWWLCVFGWKTLISKMHFADVPRQLLHRCQLLHHHVC